ncbi:FHA domain-containing protein [Kitasatospora sp. NBC_00374]|uniref:FHA domain-containing protein n=1 Tax=Kitasatospora sp. NBC_00374 TaxID=2975964 RepID=UPI0030E0C817
MTSLEFRTQVARPSQVERDRALDVLREGVGNGQLSHDTFIRRMELVLTARSRAELATVVADLQTYGRFQRAVLRGVAKVSAFQVRLRRTWETEQLPGLRLPGPGAARVVIGRQTGADLRLGDASVSRVHAELRPAADGWVLQDLGSSNGTFVNGLRVVGAVSVRAGDQVRFGRLGFQLIVE